MVSLLRSRAGSKSAVSSRPRTRGLIGVDIGNDSVLIAQLAANGKDVALVAGGSRNRPSELKCGSVDWQRWVIETIRELTSESRFRGKEVVATVPTGDVFIDHIRVPDGNGESLSDHKLHSLVQSKINHKLPFAYADAMVKCIRTEENHAVVIATERKIIDRHLAIYEHANLTIKSICVWPDALINSYVAFFGRRQSDIQTVVMLIEIDTNCTNVVICRHRGMLFARSIAIGTDQLASDEMVTRLVMELTASKRHFSSMYKRIRIDRVIFMASQDSGKGISAKIAKQLEMPAQMGDCLAAVKVPNPANAGIDRRECQFNWTNAFGLSLS